jgi:low affinity Fe/Cu permease
MIVFNTAISTVTFLAVFLIQSAQNRNAKALHLKMNELIRGVEGPRTELVNLEQRTNAEMRELDKEFAQVAEEAIQEAPASPAQTKRKADPART